MPPMVSGPHALQVLRFKTRQIQFVFARAGANSARSSARGPWSGRRGGHEPPRPRPLAVHRQAGPRAVADGRVAAAPDRRTQLGADRQRAPATCASASCCCRRSTARRSSATPQMIRDATERRDRQVADRHAVRARATHAGDHARGDHVRDLRCRGRPERRDRRAAPACQTIEQLTAASTSPMAKLGELVNLGREEPVGLMRRGGRDARRGDLPRDQGAPPRRRSRGAARHPLAAARRAPTRTARRSPTKSSATSC